MHGGASHTTTTTTCTERYSSSRMQYSLTLTPLFLCHTWPDKPQAEYAEGIEALLVHFLQMIGSEESGSELMLTNKVDAPGPCIIKHLMRLGLCVLVPKSHHPETCLHCR